MKLIVLMYALLVLLVVFIVSVIKLLWIKLKPGWYHHVHGVFLENLV